MLPGSLHLQNSNRTPRVAWLLQKLRPCQRVQSKVPSPQPHICTALLDPSSR